MTALEPGSIPQNTWIVKYNSAESAKLAYESLDLSDLSLPEPPLVLIANAVPDEGFPPELSFVPTRANVDAGPSQPPTLMLIEGSAEDQDRMDRYRDIILPMMRERGSYYTCFELGGEITVLSGDWSEAIFAISRWPGAHLPVDFWMSPKYQNDAIPLRLDHSRFDVVILEGERDD